MPMGSSPSSMSSFMFATGIVEAAIAPLFMVLGFYAWDHHWNGSPFSLNLFKCNVAAIGFAIVVVVINLAGGGGSDGGGDSDGSVNDNNITVLKVAMLMMSSFLGIVLGDFCWLEGMRVLSARKIILIDCLKPFLAAFVGWAWFDEKLGAAAYVGLALTVGGLLLVEMEQTDQDRNEKSSEIQLTPLTEEDESTSIVVSEEDAGLVQRRSSQTTTQRSESYAEKRNNEQHTTATLIYGYIVSLLNVILHTCGATLTKMYGVGMNTWLVRSYWMLLTKKETIHWP
jgi:uncharacterized membrane protein